MFTREQPIHGLNYQTVLDKIYLLNAFVSELIVVCEIRYIAAYSQVFG
jgi:hypothetical protein